MALSFTIKQPDVMFNYLEYVSSFEVMFHF